VQTPPSINHKEYQLFRAATVKDKRMQSKSVGQVIDTSWKANF